MTKPAQTPRTALPAPAKGIVEDAATSYLRTKGWKMRPIPGPWRWFRPDWRIRSYYTKADAHSLQRELDKGAR